MAKFGKTENSTAAKFLLTKLMVDDKEIKNN